MKNTRLIYVISLLLLGGCASNVPLPIKLPPEQDINYVQAKDSNETFQGQYARWGGKIIAIENKKDSTMIEIMANSLNSYGRPSRKENYEGRFIARVDGFLDPEEYAKDRELTVFGKIEDKLVKNIDDHPYDYPLIYAEEYHLWPEYKPIHPPYPYYYRHHPYYYYPYYRHNYGFHHYR
jgi:outer membrane lipoprotein